VERRNSTVDLLPTTLDSDNVTSEKPEAPEPCTEPPKSKLGKKKKTTTKHKKSKGLEVPEEEKLV
jgi:hypothetical protein